jgi:hypothetical protein
MVFADGSDLLVDGYLSRSLFISLQGIVMMGSSERIRVPWEIFSIATRPFPFPGTSCKAYMKFSIVICNFTSPAPSKFPLFSVVTEIAAVNSDNSYVSSAYSQW